MIYLHYFPGNASMIPHILLEELGIPFELVLVDRTQNLHKSADYLRLNPNGKIPTLVQTSPALPNQARPARAPRSRAVRDRSHLPALQRHPP